MRRYLLLFTFIAGLVLLVGAAPNSQVEALESSDFDPGHLLDNAVMRDKNSMNVSEIQRFIEAKQPGCEENHSETNKWKDFGQPYTCLEDYKEDPSVPIQDCTQKQMEKYGFNKLEEPDKTVAKSYCWWTRGRANLQGQTVSTKAKSASRIIYDASQKHNINPQVILVMLHKEQSLLSDVWPWVGQYQKALGYSCPDTDRNGDGQPDCDPSYRGLYNQVNGAAGMLDRLMREEGSNYYPPGKNDILYYLAGSGCGQSEVNIRNLATSALYNYTPYQPNKSALDYKLGTANSYNDCATFGNLNFWLLFHDWFGSPTPSKDITVMTSPSTNKYYLISGDKKVHIATLDAYNAWGLDDIPLTRVEDSVLESYHESKYPLRRLARSQQSGVVYLVDDQKGYSLPNQNRADVWDIDTSKKPTIDNKAIKNLTNRTALPVIVNSPVGPEKYLMDGGTLRHFPTFDVLNAWENNRSEVTLSEKYYCKRGTGGDNCEPRWPVGGRLWNTRVKDTSGNSFLIDKNKRYSLNSSTSVSAFGNSEANISKATIERKQDGGQMELLVKVSGEPHVYLLNGSKINRIGSPTHLEHWKPNGDGSTTKISADLAELTTVGKAIYSFTATDGKETYYMDQTRHPLGSKLKNAFTAHKTPVQLSSSTLSEYKEKPSSPLATSPQTNKIFFVNSGGTKHHIATLRDYKLMKNNIELPTLSVPSKLLDAIETEERVRYRFTSGDNTYLLDNDGYHTITSDHWKLSPSFTIDNASLGWFEKKADLADHFKNGSKYGVVRNGALYTSSNKRLGLLWGASDTSPVLSDNLMKKFTQKPLSPFVDSKSKDNPRIYVYDSNDLYHIPTISAWKNLGVNRFNGRVTLSEDQITSLANGRSTYILSSDDGIVENGNRRNFTNTSSANAWVTDSNQKYSQKLIDLYAQKTSDPVNALITSSETSKWFCVEDGKKRWVTSFSALDNSSCSDESLTSVSYNLLKQVPTGSNIN